MKGPSLLSCFREMISGSRAFFGGRDNGAARDELTEGALRGALDFLNQVTLSLIVPTVDRDIVDSDMDRFNDDCVWPRYAREVWSGDGILRRALLSDGTTDLLRGDAAYDLSTWRVTEEARLESVATPHSGFDTAALVGLRASNRSSQVDRLRPSLLIGG